MENNIYISSANGGAEYAEYVVPNVEHPLRSINPSTQCSTKNFKQFAEKEERSSHMHMDKF